MKYCVLIMDGAAGWPLVEYGGKTCLELAHTPNLDYMAQRGVVGLIQTVPPGMEPSSGCACMSILGYNPRTYYQGRSAIEARSMNVPIKEGEVVFRCNLVAVRDGKMLSYSCGHISTSEAQILIAALNKKLGSGEVHFYSGVSYRHICKMKGCDDALLATCTPPHDIPGKAIREFMPEGPGSACLLDLMKRSEAVLCGHPVNEARRSRGDIPATMIWLFWGSRQIPDMPAFKLVCGLDAAMTSGVDLLRGLAKVLGIEVLNIHGVTGDQDNDYNAQALGALESLEGVDLVVIHVEAPDEAAHAGLVDDKVEAIQRIDSEIVKQLCSWNGDSLRILVMPDHLTPIEVQTHIGEPVPFMLYGPGFASDGAERFTEAEAKNTGVLIREGHNIMAKLIG